MISIRAVAAVLILLLCSCTADISKIQPVPLATDTLLMDMLEAQLAAFSEAKNRVQLHDYIIPKDDTLFVDRPNISG